IGLLVFGILSLLAILTDAIGPTGRAIDTGAGLLLGQAKLFVPLGLLIGAALLLAPHLRAEEDEEEEGSGYGGWRLGVGLGLIAAAPVGLLYVAQPDSGVDANGGAGNPPLEDSGGLLGHAVGGPLQAGLGTTGAVIVLVAAGVLGLLLVIGT